MEKVTGRFSFLVIASACLLIAGCHAPIDVDLAYDSIKDADGRLVDNGIEILTEKFGEPHAPSAGQLRKMENQEKSYRGSRGKTDFSNFKVWGNDSKFLVTETGSLCSAKNHDRWSRLRNASRSKRNHVGPATTNGCAGAVRSHHCFATHDQATSNDGSILISNDPRIFPLAAFPAKSNTAFSFRAMV